MLIFMTVILTKQCICSNVHGCVKNEGLIMRITAIRNYSPCCTASKVNRGGNTRVNIPQTEPQSDTLTFKGATTIKGAGIGALVGIGALTLLTGGAAAPIAYGLYAATMGTAGGMLGSAIENSGKDNKKDDKDN